METLFRALRFLYVGSADFERDFTYYRDTLGAERLWQFEAFGAKVAAFRLGDAPPLLLADHRPAPSCLPVYEVANLTETARMLTERGWKPDGERFEIPNGPCYLFHDPSGNPFALFEDVRPSAMEHAFADEHNPRAVRE